MGQIIEQNTENHVKETSAPSLSTAAGHDVSAPEVSGASPLPSLAGVGETPAHLASLADRARGYVQAASSANTRKAYAADWKHFSAWCRRSNLAPLPPHPQTVGSTSQHALPGPLNGVQKRTQPRPSNAASPRFPGIMRSGASRSIARTGTLSGRSG